MKLDELREQPCFLTPELTTEEQASIHALHQGVASEYQQRLALKVIITKFSRAHDVLFVPDSPSQTAFLEGRGFVGIRILKTLNLPIARKE